MNFTTSTSRLAGGVGNTVSFIHRSDTRSWNFGYQDILFFSDLALAKAGFREVANATVPPAAIDQYEVPDELRFTVNADESVIGCLPMSMNGDSFLGCGMAARYGNYVTQVHANLAEVGGLTLSRLGAILQGIDQRMTTLKEQ